jgi:hypothetical protein
MLEAIGVTRSRPGGGGWLVHAVSFAVSRGESLALAVVSPIEAVKYQIVIMFLIAAGTALGTVASVPLSFRLLFNERHQFLYGKMAAPR